MRFVRCSASEVPDPDGDVWDITEYRGRYGGVLGASTVQQLERKNREAWKSFFSLKKKGEANGKPGFWGNSEAGRELRTYIRNTSYSVEWGEYSRLEILIGKDLKDEYSLGYRNASGSKFEAIPAGRSTTSKVGWSCSTTSKHNRSGPFSQSPLMILGWHNHWLRKKPLWTSVRTISSPAQPQLASNSCKKDATCSSDSTRQREKLPSSNRCWRTVGTVATVSDACTTCEPSDVTTLKTHSPVTSSNACTTKAFR